MVFAPVYRISGVRIMTPPLRVEVGVSCTVYWMRNTASPNALTGYQYAPNGEAPTSIAPVVVFSVAWP